MHPPPSPSQTLEFPRVIRDAEENKPFFFFLPSFPLPPSTPPLLSQIVYKKEEGKPWSHSAREGEMVFTKFTQYVVSKSW